jgi:hypothetical protein
MKTKSIKPVNNFGVTGFQVTFSILDLYKMQQLAFELEAKVPKNELSEMVNKLFKATIGTTNDEWDFLQTDEEPCTK